MGTSICVSYFKMFLAFILLGFVFDESFLTINARIITTKQGRLEGLDQKARNERPFTSFFGVPYAQAPIGKLRFMPPVPAGRWKGTLNAKEPNEQCPQVNRNQTGLDGDEDCLYVDIHVPESIEAGDNTPVTVYFFGGGFTAGNTQREGPQYMMERDIIIVMVSSRLSVFGFLSTQDDVIPGNMGLKDQTQALRWVKQYIADYGGDPNRVLIAGHSSGAACVHLHTYSPLSRGLFHRIASLSGLGIAPHLFMDPDVAKDLTNHLAKGLNCPLRSDLLLPCLQNMTKEEVMKVAEKTLRIWHQIPTAIFRPTVESPNNPGSFLIDYPHNHKYASTDIPWMVGMTSGEGAFYVNEYFGRLDGLDVHPNMILSLYGMNLWTTKPSQLNYVSQLIQGHFFGDDRLGAQTDEIFADYLTGIMHGLSLVDVLEGYKGQKYVYLYDYRAAYSYQLDITKYGKYLGVGHADGLGLLFRERGTERLFTSTDFDFGDELITKWVNFAYSGNPNEPFPLRTELVAAWEPMHSERIEFLRIRMNGTMEQDYFLQKFNFWRKLPIFSKYRSSPVPQKF